MVIKNRISWALIVDCVVGRIIFSKALANHFFESISDFPETLPKCTHPPPYRVLALPAWLFVILTFSLGAHTANEQVSV